LTSTLPVVKSRCLGPSVSLPPPLDLISSRCSTPSIPEQRSTGLLYLARWPLGGSGLRSRQGLSKEEREEDFRPRLRPQAKTSVNGKPSRSSPRSRSRSSSARSSNQEDAAQDSRCRLQGGIQGWTEEI